MHLPDLWSDVLQIQPAFDCRLMILGIGNECATYHSISTYYAASTNLIDFNLLIDFDLLIYFLLIYFDLLFYFNQFVLPGTVA